MNISIYTVYHTSSHIVENHIIKPIQVGFGTNIDSIKYRDSSGDNICNKNDTYCELTAQYWMWKNDRSSDYLGLMHYRRYFDFSQVPLILNQYGFYKEQGFTVNFKEKYGLSESIIKKCIQGYDIVLPTEWDVSHSKWKNVRDNYENSQHHFARDLQITEGVVKDLYPQDWLFFDQHMRSKHFCATNMFIMRRDLFEQYSEWLFSILEEVERRLDISDYSAQERRVFGYLAERLLNVWILKIKNENPNLRFKYLNRIFVQNTKARNWIAPLPLTNKPLVSVVIASDDNYVPHLGALIKSIQCHFSDENHLDLIILDGGISALNQTLLEKMTMEHHSSSICFIELENEFAEHETHMHFTKATFYRLILDQLIHDRERLLYIDCDTIVLDDVANLYKADLNGKAIGAVYDYIMHHFCQNQVRSMSEADNMEARKYLESYVGMGNNWDKYFQAGVLLIDMPKVKSMNLSDSMIDDLLEKKYWFLDQDILNKYFQDDIEFLDPRWNYVNCGDNIYNGLKRGQIQELEKARLNPAIIHYAGFETKPWNNMSATLSEYYFYYLRQTYWYEKVVYLSKSYDHKGRPKRTLKYRVVKGLWTAIPKSIRRRMNAPSIIRGL